MYRLCKLMFSVEVQLLLAALVGSAPALVLAQSPPATGSVLVIPGVAGESSVVPGGIDILSYSIGAEVPVGMPRATFTDFNFTANTSSASPVLLLNVAMQRHAPTATIFVRRTDLDGQPQYLTYTLTDVTVGKVLDSTPSTPGLPVEGFSLRYARIAIEYHVVNPDGTLGPPILACWDVVRQAAC